MMKLFIPILFLLLVLSVLLLVEACPEFNITRGSSLSTYSPNNESSINSTYWLSPSGNFAFGFYPLCSDCRHYIVGIWLIKSTNKTLVWYANHRKDPPLRHPSSILFNNKGKLVVRTADDREKPLLIDMWEPTSYAAVLDNGNFVLYDSNSKIIWESFDYPTDTILGGQMLKSGQNLISSVFRSNESYYSYKLSMEQQSCDVDIYCFNDRDLDAVTYYYSHYVSSDCGNTTRTQIGPVSLNLEPTTGQIYLLDWDESVLKNITNGENQTQLQQQQEVGSMRNVVYRATLETDGYFRLYKQIFGSEGEKSILLWYPQMNKPRDCSSDNYSWIMWPIIGIIWVICIVIMCLVCYEPCQWLWMKLEKIRSYDHRQWLRMKLEKIRSQQQVAPIPN